MVTPRYTRKATEKIWNFLQEIEERRQLSSSGKDIRLPFMPQGFQGTSLSFDLLMADREAIMHKLENLGVVDGLGHREGIDGFWHFRIGKNYEKVFEEYASTYSEMAKEVQQHKVLEEVKLEDPLYQIMFSEKSREILINGFLLKKPDSFSENEMVFAYLFRNPNQQIQIKDMELALKEELTKSIHKILENLGFIGELKEVFFKVSKTTILFRNPITKRDLEEMGLKHIRFR